MSVTDSQMLAGFDLHDVLGRSLVSKPITMHWRHNGKLGCEVLVGEAEVTSIHCSAFRYLLLKDSFCSLCMEAARNVIDQEDRELLAAKPGESIASAAKRAERVPPKPPQMEVVKD